MMPRLLLGLLALVAIARVAIGGWPAARRPPRRPETPALPAVLDGRERRPVPLHPSEELLARSPNVALVRARYGSTGVALLSARGLKEHHPPTVCLRAAGLEIVERREEPAPAGCLLALRVRDRRGQLLHLFATSFDQRRVTCRFHVRAAHAAWTQLLGRPAVWTTLQVLDRDPHRARATLLALLPSMREHERTR